jgi:dipeptidyl-peptidase-4
VYGGPEAPTTANVFGNARGLYHQVLAEHGFIVFSIDGPGSQIDDETHVRMLYHNLGPVSLLGQRIGVDYLKSQPYVDASRIGIWGWSFGGYESAYALTHSNLFKAGAAGAPVTDWRFYDSAYTERYMGLPASDVAAYDASSVVNSTQALAGDLLISHGTSDDNVHIANSVSLLQQIVNSDRLHLDFMEYPGQRHGFTAQADLRHVYERMLNWWMTHL